MARSQYRSEYGRAIDVIRLCYREIQEDLKDEELKYIRYYIRHFMEALRKLGDPNKSLEYPSISKLLTETQEFFKGKNVIDPNQTKETDSLVLILNKISRTHSNISKKLESLPTGLTESQTNPSSELLLKHFSTSLVEVSEDLKDFMELEKTLSLESFDENSECPVQVFEEVCKYI